MEQSTDSHRRPHAMSGGGLAPDQLVQNRYRVIRRIGAGAYGTVYAVQHVALGKSFALKVLNAQAQRNWRSIARFQAEAVTASKIDHPHIVSVTDVGQTEDGQAYYVMELLEGETLAAVLKREKGRMLSLSRAIPILAATAHGLHAAHETGVVHRDLKPENVFLVPQEDVQLGITKEVVRILDFGLAKVLESPGVTVEGITYGTPGYMAPEQIRGEKIDRRADIYSIGCIAYEMLAGRPLYTGSAMDVAMAHIEQEPAPFNAPSPRMHWLVERCLKKDPRHRFQTCRALLEELRAIAIELLTPEGHTKQIEFAVQPLDTTALGARDSYPSLDPNSEDSWWDEFSSIAKKAGGREETRPLIGGSHAPDAPDPPGDPDEEQFGGATLIDDRPFGQIHQEYGLSPSASPPGSAPSAAALASAPPLPVAPPSPSPGPALAPIGRPPRPSARPRPEPALRPPDVREARGEVPRRQQQSSASYFPVENTLEVDDLPVAGPTGIGRVGWYLLIGGLALILLLLGLLSYRVLSMGGAKGALVVNVAPEAAEVAIDGTVHPGSGAMRVVNDLPARGVVVSASHDGCTPKIRRLEIKKGRVQVVELKLDCEK